MRRRLQQMHRRAAIIARGIWRALIAPFVGTRTISRALVRKLDDRDGVMLVGLALLAVGLGLQSVSLALIVTGALLFALAVLPPFLIRRGGG